MAAAKKRPKRKPSGLTQHNSSLQALIAEVISLRERVAKAELIALNRKTQKAMSTEAAAARRPKISSRTN